MRLFLWTIICLAAMVSEVLAGRIQRKVAFRKGSKFFLRLNFKENVLSYNTIFAHASGFKVLWDLPEGGRVSGRRAIRDIHENMEFMYDSHGLNGKSCLLKNICNAAEYVNGRSGVIAKILRLILGSSNGTSIEAPANCDDYQNMCPLDLISVSPLSEY